MTRKHHDNDGDIDRFAAQPLDDADQRILTRMRTMWEERDPVPQGMTDRIRFAMTVASLHAEVADLVQRDHATAGVRTTYERATSMTFVAESLSVMVEIRSEQAHGSGTALTGWTSEPGVEVELREREQSRTTTSDDAGRFSFDGVHRGLVHMVLRITDDASPPVITPTFEV